jgi:hypothetical protein
VFFYLSQSMIFDKDLPMFSLIFRVGMNSEKEDLNDS